MSILRKVLLSAFIFGVILPTLAALPSRAFAHEVYVLTPEEIRADVSMPSPNPFSAIPSEQLLFLESGAIAILLVLVVLHFSLSKFLERALDPLLVRLKKYAPLAGRLTLGASLVASGWYRALFGPELPFSQLVGPGAAGIVSILFILLGIAILAGLRTRLAALGALCFFVLAVFEDRSYMLTYLNYLGEILLALILGGGAYSLDHVFGSKPAFAKLSKKLEKYAFLILRLCFGFAVFYASFYAKFLHSSLALETVMKYHLTLYFHFVPLFLVLGAFIVEALIGVCIMAGFEIRFVALIFMGFMTLSLSFFGEAVWPHIVLFGVCITLLLHGYDEYTLEKRLFAGKNHKEEPVF